MASPMTCPQCGSQHVVSATTYVDSQGRQSRMVGIYSGCLVICLILVFIVVLVEVVTFALTPWPDGWSRISMTLGSAVGPLIALAAISRFRSTVQYRCQHCQHEWLSRTHTAQRLLDEQEHLGQSERLAAMSDLAKHPDPLTVNALLRMLDYRDTATREAAASKLRGMLDQLDDLPATRAGVERALQDYEHVHR